jgi:PAS domain S-box-containing protein
VQVSKCQRTILGIDGMMSDTASLHVLLNSLVDRSRFPNATIVFRYTLVTEEAVVAGNQMMARWVMTTLNATQCGARMEVAKQGMLCCKFNSAHKIIGLELMFDVMALMLQLKQSAGSDTFSVIPNTVQTCQRSFDKPMAMILAVEPYTIVQVNKLWEDMTGYKAEEVVGKTSCRILEGERTNRNAVEVLMNEVRFKRPASAMVLSYKKTGERFRNFFLAYPLSTDSRITHYLMFSTHVEPVADVGMVANSGSAKQSLQMSVSNPLPTVVSQVTALQPNYLAQNLQANFISARQQAAVAGALPESQNLMSLDTVMTSNPVGMLQSSLPPTPTPNGMLPQQQQAIQQQFQQTALKRPLESVGGEIDSRKQPKTDGLSTEDLATYVPPSGSHSSNSPNAQTIL